MKYAFMSFSRPQATLAEMAREAAALGYAGLEPRIGIGHRHGVEPAASPAERERFRRETREAGVGIVCVATGCTFADPASAPRQLEEARAAVKLAGEVGASLIRVFGGEYSGERSGALASIVASLKALAPFAREHGVVVCLETHDAWTNPRAVADIMEQVGHPSIAVNWDILHPVRVDGLPVEAAYRLLKPWIRHVHVHDAELGDPTGPIVYRSMGVGTVDHRTAVRLLAADGYAGSLSGEWIDYEPHPGHLAAELAALRSYERGIGRDAAID